MTDRVEALTIVLDEDVREDDVESLIHAILHFKGVIAVTKNKVQVDSYVARERVRREMLQNIHSLINEKSGDH